MTSKFKSEFERRFVNDLENRGIEYAYEAEKFHYSVPKSYRPDFKVGKFFIECKGYHRGIHQYLHSFIHFKRQHPNVDVRFVFDVGISTKRVSKTTKMTFADWANRNNIKWAEEIIPEEWLHEVLPPSDKNVKQSKTKTPKKGKKDIP